MSGEEEVVKGVDFPENDAAYAAVFNVDGEFSPLVDDGKRVASVEEKGFKKLKVEQLKSLATLMTGKHAKMMQIDFYRPTAGVWFEKDGKVVGFFEFSFESFSRRSSVKGVSLTTDWKGLAKWFDDLGLTTNWDAGLYGKMVRKETDDKEE